MKPKKVIKPFSVVEQIKKSLPDAILNQELQPGTPLTEMEPQGWLGVSRAPIRDIISVFESEDLVEVNAFKEKYVRKYTDERGKKSAPCRAAWKDFPPVLWPAGQAANNSTSCWR
ncbi:MAG: GntR family transcriptional regulator [Syntrophobacteraceae bacterium]